jgi:hypothetical protein
VSPKFSDEHGGAVTRISPADAIRDELNDDRDHLAIQISLLADADVPDVEALGALRLKMFNLERRISKHRAGDVQM